MQKLKKIIFFLLNYNNKEPKFLVAMSKKIDAHRQTRKILIIWFRVALGMKEERREFDEAINGQSKMCGLSAFLSQ